MLKNYFPLVFVFFFLSSIYSQTTYVPDDAFEQRLIHLGYDDALDDYVLTSLLWCYTNKLTSLDDPVTNILTIDSEIPLTKVEIYSMLGKKVKEVNSDINSISTNNLSNGVYIVRMYSENGIATKKLIKK